MTENNNTKLQIRLPLLFALTLAAGMFIGQKLPHRDGFARFLPNSAAGAQAGAIEEVMRYIASRYVDSVQMDEIKTSAIDETTNTCVIFHMRDEQAHARANNVTLLDNNQNVAFCPP